MKTFFSLLLLCITGWCGSARAQQLMPVKEINAEITDFTTDNLGNIYLLTKENQLKKYNEKGDSVSVYNDVRRFGKVFCMDASNPLKLMLYYKDFSTVLELDRLLNVRNTIDLKKLNIFQPKAVGVSNDNRTWVYDEMDARLKKVAEDGSLLLATTDLRQALDTLPSPIKLADQDAVVYLYDPEKGVYLFDYYGTLKNRIPFRHWLDFQVLGKYMFGRKANILYRYEPGSLSLSEQNMGTVFDEALKVRISTQRIYILYPGKLVIYSL